MTTDGSQTPVEKPKPKEGEQPPAEPTPLQTEADLARRNGDGTPPPTDKPANAPKVEIVDPSKVRRLDDKSIAALSEEVKSALNSRALGFLWRSPDFDKIKRSLENLNPADRAALEKQYDGNEPGKLRRELKERLSEREFREVEAQLNRTGDRTNDAGAVVVALARMKEEEKKGTNIDPNTGKRDYSNSRANAELREIFSSMTAEQIAQLRKDFAEKYPEFKGKSLEEVIRSTPGLGTDTAAGLDILMKGMPGRDKDGKPTGTGKTADDMRQLGEIAIRNGNLQMLVQSINGDTPEAVAARKALQSNPQLMEQFNKTWGKNQAAKDILVDGRVSIATIASGNTPSWWFDNPKNTTQAIDGATEKERTDYRNGRAYANGAKPPDGTDPAEVQRQIEYYKRVHKAFVDNGGGYNDRERDRQVAIWEDHMLTPKGSIISQMAETHEGMSGFLGIGFGFTGGHNKQDLFSKVEGISKEDWQILHDEFKANPNGGGPFMQRIRDSLKTYTDKGEQERILTLLEQKAKKDKYEDAVTVRRGVMDTIEDNRTTTLWGAINTGFTKKNIGDAIANMSEDEAKKYRENTGGVRETLDKWIKENMTPDEQAYARRMLERRTAVTPQDKQDPAKQQQAIERLASGANSNDTNQRLRDIEIARTRINAAEEAIKKGERKEPLTEQEKKAKEVIATEDAVDKLLKSKVDGGSATERLKAVEAALADPGLRARLNKPADQMTAEDKLLKGVVNSTMMDAVMASGAYYAGSQDPQAYERLQQQANAATDALLKNGFIPPDLKMDLGFKAPDVYNNLYKEGVTQAQRDAALARMNEQERMIALQVGKNEVPIPGTGPPPKTEHKMEPVDELRSMIVRGASSEEMISTLKRMKEEWLTQQQQKPEAERQQWADRLGDLYSQYEQRYGKKPDGTRNTSTLFDDIMSKMKPEEQLQTRTLLTRERLDGRQVAYDAFNIMQDNQGGANFDASHDTAERQVQAFRDALQQGQGEIPPDKLDELTKLFAESIKQYKESKEKAAEIITTAIIMAAAIAATVASGGAASPMLVLALGGMGALTKVAGHMIAEGGSFEMTLKNVMKKTVEGFVTGSLSALGPESFTFLTGTSRVAIPAVSKAVLEGAEGAVLRTLIKEGGETTITKALRQSFADAAAYNRPMDFKAIAKSLLSKEEVVTLPGGKQVLASELLEQSLRTQFELQTGQVLRTAGTESFMQTAKNVVVREGLGNVVVGEAGNIASTPFINYVNGKGFNLDGYSVGWSSLMPLGFAPGMRLAVHGGVRGIQMASPLIERAQKWSVRIQEAINPNYVEFHPGIFAAQHPDLNAKVIDKATGKEIWHTGQTEAFRFDPSQHQIIDAATGKPIDGPTPFLRKASAADQTGRVISGAETGDPNITILSRKGDRIEAQVGNNRITTENGIPTHVQIGDVSVTQSHTAGGIQPTEVKIKDGDQVRTYKQDTTGRWVDEAGQPAPFATVGVNQINGSISFEYPPDSGKVAQALHLNGEVDNWMDNGTIMRTGRDGNVTQAGTFDLTPGGALEGPLAVKPTGTQVDAVHFAPGASPQEVRLSESLSVTTRATSDGRSVVETVRFRNETGDLVEYRIDTKTGKYTADGKPAAFSQVEVKPENGTVTFKYSEGSEITSRVMHTNGESYVMKADGSMQRVSADGTVTAVPREAQSAVVKITQAPESVLTAAQKSELVDNTLASFRHQTETLPEQLRAELKARKQELKLTDAEIDVRVKLATEYNQRNFARTTSEIDATIARGAGTEGRDVRTTLAATLEDSRKRADLGAALRQDLLDVKVTKDGGGVTDVWSKFEKDPKLSVEQKDRIFNILAESKHYYAEIVPRQVETDLRAKAARGELDLNAPVKDAEVRARMERGEISPTEARIQDGVIASRNYQEVNWKHTRGEIDQVLESTRLRPNMTANQVEDAVLGSIYSDMVKSPSNFIVHNIDGAKAAAEILPRHFDMSVPGNAERVQSIVTAIKEHQIGPPQFMSDMNEMFIGGSVKSQLTNNATALKTANGGTLSADDAAVLSGLEKRLAPTFGAIPTRQPLSEAEVQFLKNAGKASNPDDPDKLLRDFKEYLDNINEIKRKISDPLNPAHHTADGTQIAFTDAEKRLLGRIGVQDWTVPHNSPHYLASRSIIDGDSLINYATPDGWAKIAAIRGPDTPFAFDKTVFDSLASAKASYNDAYKVMSDEARILGEKGVVLTEKAVARVKTVVNVDGVANDGMEGWLKRTVEQRGQQYGYGDTVRQRIWESEEFKRQMAEVESQARAKGAAQAEIDAAKEALKARVDKISFWDPDAIPLSQLKQFGFTDADIQARMQLAREIRSNMVERLRAEQTNWAEFNTPPRVVAPGTTSPASGPTPLTTNRPAALGAGFYRDLAAKPGTNITGAAAPVGQGKTDARVRLGEELTDDATKQGAIGQGGPTTQQQQTGTHGPGQHQAPKTNDDTTANAGTRGQQQPQPGATNPSVLNAAADPNGQSLTANAGPPHQRDSVKIDDGNGNSQVFTRDASGRWTDADGRQADFVAVTKDLESGSTTFHYPPDSLIATRIHQADGTELIYRADGTVIQISPDGTGESVIGKWNAIPNRVQAPHTSPRLRQQIAQKLESLTPSRDANLDRISQRLAETNLGPAEKAELEALVRQSHTYHTETLPELYRRDLQTRAAELGLTQPEIDVRVQQAREYYARNWETTQQALDSHLDKLADSRDASALFDSLHAGTSRAELAARLRSDLLEVRVTGRDGLPTDVWSKFEADLTLGREQKDRIFNVLAEARHYYTETLPAIKAAELRAALIAGTIDEFSVQVQLKAAVDYQVVNWKHTRGEIDQVLESTRLNKSMTPNQVEDAILGSTFSDMIKTPQNFIVHNIHGAQAAEAILPRYFDMSDPTVARRVEGLLQATKEHQIGPAIFMSNMNELFIGFSLRADLGAAAKGLNLNDAEKATLAALGNRLNPQPAAWDKAKPWEAARPALTSAEENLLKKLGASKSPADADALLRDFQDYNTSINSIKRKIANPFDTAHHTADGGYINFTEAEQRLLNKIGVSEWSVPHSSSEHYHASRAIVDGDSLINYATPDGWAKIAAIRNTEPFILQDATIFDALRSAHDSFQDARLLMTEGARVLGDDGLSRTVDLVRYVRKGDASVQGMDHFVDNHVRELIRKQPERFGYPPETAQLNPAEIKLTYWDKDAPTIKSFNDEVQALQKRVAEETQRLGQATDETKAALARAQEILEGRKRLASLIRDEMVSRLREQQNAWADLTMQKPPLVDPHHLDFDSAPTAPPRAQRSGFDATPRELPPGNLHDTRIFDAQEITDAVVGADNASQLGRFRLSSMDGTAERFDALTKNEISLGRADDGINPDVQFSGAGVSRKHARIYWDEASGKAFIEDVDSSNGTWLHDGTSYKLVSRPTELKPGDRIRLGRESDGAKFTFEETPQPRPSLQDTILVRLENDAKNVTVEPRRPLQQGDEVQLDGREHPIYQVVLRDSDGNVLVKQNNRNAAMYENRETYNLNDYTKVQTDKRAYYVDRDGTVFIEVDFGNGRPILVSEPKMAFVPEARLQTLGSIGVIDARSPFKVNDNVLLDGERARVVAQDRTNGKIVVRIEADHAVMSLPAKDLDKYEKVRLPGTKNTLYRRNDMLFEYDALNNQLFPTGYRIVDAVRLSEAPKPLAYGVGSDVGLHLEDGRFTTGKVLGFDSNGDPVINVNAARPNPAALEFNGRVVYVDGFDPKTGDAIINGVSYKRVDIGGAQPMYKGPDGKLYQTEFSQSGHGQFLYVDERFIVHPRDQVQVGFVEASTLKAADFDDIRSVSLPQNVSGKGIIHLQAANVHDIYKGATIDFPGHELPVNFQHVIGDSLSFSRTSLGLGSAPMDLQVSRNQHALVKWDPKEQLYYVSDSSTLGTWVVRPGLPPIKVHKDGPIKAYYLSPGDELRLGAADGHAIKLNLGPESKALTWNATDSWSPTATQIFFDGKPIHLNSEGVVAIGRLEQSFGNNNPLDALNRRVARDKHVTIEWRAREDGSMGFLVQDHTEMVSSPNRGRDAYHTVLALPGIEGMGNGTWVTKPNGQQLHILPGQSMFIEPGDVVRLGSPDGPPVKFVQTTGTPSVNGMGTVYYRENGDFAIKRPDGTTRIQTRVGDVRLVDRDNKIIQVTDLQGNSRRFTYNENGVLIRIDFSDGSYATTIDGKVWTRTELPAGEQPFFRGFVAVESDGSLRFSNPASKEAAIHRLDGTVETLNASGRVSYTPASRDLELSRLKKLANDFPPGNRERFQQLLDDVTTARADLPAGEQALVYLHVRRLLQADSGAMLGMAERRALAEQMIYQTLNPRTIDQGANNTCNVTTIEKRIFSRKPSEAINLITDVATKGKYVTASGVLVDFSRIPGLLTPDAEARALLNANYLRMDGARSYASQVFETAAVNIKYSAAHWAEVNDVKILKGDVVVYEKVPDATTRKGEREQLVKYSVVDDRLQQTVIADSPYVGSSQLPHIHNEIVGGNETGFIFMGSRFPDSKGNVGNWKHGQFGTSVNIVQNAQDLARQLESAAAAGKLPAVIAVHTSHPYFGHGQGGNPTGGGGHVMNIHGIRKVMVNGRERMFVDVTNQWGKKYNRLFPVEDLYALTGPMDASIPGGVVHAQAPRSDAASLSRVGNQGEHAVEAPPEVIRRTGDRTSKPIEFSYADVVSAAHRGEDIETTLGRLNAEQQMAALRTARDQDVFPFDQSLTGHFNEPRGGFVDRDPLLPISSQRPDLPEFQRVHASGRDLVVAHQMEDGTIIGLDPSNFGGTFRGLFGGKVSTSQMPDGESIQLHNGKKLRVDFKQETVFEFDERRQIWINNKDYRIARSGTWEEIPPVPSANDLRNMGSSTYHTLVQNLDVRRLSDSDLAALIVNRPASSQAHTRLALEFLRRAETNQSRDIVDAFTSLVSLGNKVDPGSYAAIMAQFPVERLASPERIHLLNRLQLHRPFEGAAEANSGLIKRLLQSASEDELLASRSMLNTHVSNNLSRTALEKMSTAEQSALLGKLWRVSGNDQKLKQSLIGLLGPASLRHFDLQDLPEVTAMLRNQIGTQDLAKIDQHVETMLHKLDEDPSVRAYLELSDHRIDGADLDFVRINHINARMELLANDLQGNRWLKQGSERGRPISKLTVITFAEASDGGALSYLFQKATGIRPDIKVVKTVKELEQLQSTPGFRHAVVFDDISKAKGPLREAIGRSSDSIHVHTSIQSLHESPVNLFTVMPLLADVHVPAVDVSKPTLLRSLDLSRDDEISRIVAHETELRRAQIYLYLRNSKDIDRVDLAALHAEGMQHVTVKDMYEQAKALHGQILSDVEASPNQLAPSPSRRIIYVSDLDQTFGSSVFVNNIYRIANDIPEKDFISFAQLKKMAADGELKGTTIVHLDDTIISGDQTRERMSKLSELLRLANNDDVRISVGALAHYQGGLAQAKADVREALSRWGHFVSILSPQELPSFQQLAEAIVRKNRGGIMTGAAARVREVAGLPRYIGKDLRQATQESELVAGLIKPYQVPNNNPDRLNFLYQKHLDLPGAHSERTFEHTVTKQEWNQPFGRNRGIVSSEKRIYRSGGFTEDDMSRLDAWAAQQGEEKTLIIDLRRPTKAERSKDPAKAVISTEDEKLWTGLYEHLDYENIPLTTAKGTPPTDEQIDRFLQLMRENQGRRPIIVHCERGSDRTGLFVALYQIEVEGKSIQEVFETMRAYGFNESQLGHLLDIFDRRASLVVDRSMQADPHSALSQELLRRLTQSAGDNNSPTPWDLLSHMAAVTEREKLDPSLEARILRALQGGNDN